MTVVDLSHFITESMPVYPGTEPPRIVDACTIAKNGFAEKLLSFFSHTGTHIDAPGHILTGAATLDDLDIAHFIGPGCVLDVSARNRAQIEVGDLESQAERIAAAEFVLLHSGWAKYWGDPEYFVAYPVLTEAAARWLSGFKLKGVGVDMVSLDAVDSTALAIHRTLLVKNIVLVENLANLGALIGKEFVFFCLPLKIADADGSPIRAVAILK